MPKRFTATEKWQDEWFSNLKPLEKLVFIYMTDNCDNAGFFEVNARLNSFVIGISENEYLQAVKNLERGFYWGKTGKKVWIRTFLTHQKNWPLNETNNAHKQILNIIESNRENFEEHIKNFSPLLAPKQPLNRGLGKGIGIGNVLVDENNFEKQVYERMRTQTSRAKFSDAYIEAKASEFVEQYQGQNINKLTNLIAAWVSNFKSDIQPKKFVN